MGSLQGLVTLQLEANQEVADLPAATEGKESHLPSSPLPVKTRNKSSGTLGPAELGLRGRLG